MMRKIELMNPYNIETVVMEMMLINSLMRHRLMGMDLVENIL